MAVKVTLKTIAERTGLSVPTVSQILNNCKGNYSSEATRQKVLAAARELHYRPSFGYQLLRGKKTNTVAVLTSSQSYLLDSKSRQLFLAILHKYNEIGCTAYVHLLSNSVERNCETVRNFIHRGVEHFVIYGRPFGLNEICNIAADAGVTVIGNNDFLPRYVSNGSDSGREMILRHIVGKVGNNFKYVSYSFIHPDQIHIRALMRVYPEMPLEEIKERFLFTVSHQKLFSGRDWVNDVKVNHQLAAKRGYDAMQKLLDTSSVPGAVIFPNDEHAVGGGMCLLEKWNEKFRKNIIVAGYNNDEKLEMFPLPVISGEDNVFRQAELLVERSLDNEPCQVTVLPKLHIRQWSSEAGFPWWKDEIVQL